MRDLVRLASILCGLILLFKPLQSELINEAQQNKGQAQDDFVDETNDVLDIDAKDFQQYYNENQKLLLVFYRDYSCLKCEAVVNSLPKLIGQPELPPGCLVGKSDDKDFALKLGVKSYPALVYLRSKSYVFYDGNFELEDIIAWTMRAAKPVTRFLDDGNFEHLTQASTGATTGDWLVAFYSPMCKDILPIMETLGVRIQDKTNVAKVKTDENIDLVARFGIKNCPQVILFKQSKMYRYDLPKIDVESLKSFVDGFYKNSKAENVPVQKSGFDHLTEDIADAIKEQMEGDNKVYMLAGIAGFGLLLLIIVVVACRSMVSPPKRKVKKTKKE